MTTPRARQTPASFYATDLDPADQADLHHAHRLIALEEELALARLLLKRALRDGASLRDLGHLLDHLTRLVRTQHAVRGQAAQNLESALARLLTEVATELGLGD